MRIFNASERRLGQGPTIFTGQSWAKTQPWFAMSKFLGMAFLLTACSPVKVIDSNQFRISSYSVKKTAAVSEPVSIHVTPPDAVAGFQTQQMLYIKKPFQVESFAKNSWTNPPADMLYPLIVESLQRTQKFVAIKSSAYTGDATYRLDTLLLNLEQNFLKKPSALEFSAKITLTNVASNQIVASRLINIQIPCPSDTPYGGVIAANKASYQFTAAVTNFVLANT